MIGLDTNILLRYFTQDDPVHSRLATELIENRLTDDTPGYVSLVTLAEVVWTLKSCAKLSNADLAQIVRRMLSTKKLVLQNAQDVFEAALALEEGYGFADALIGALGLSAGCSHTFTFDRKAARLPGFELL
jgi:predicted nucleic-acid-binding protein